VSAPRKPKRGQALVSKRSRVLFRVTSVSTAYVHMGNGFRATVRVPTDRVWTHFETTEQWEQEASW
jgi:hypothetical protein